MKTALITGGSRGIGNATAHEFLKNGYKVVTTSTTGKTKIKDVNVTSYQLDLGSESSISKFASTLKKDDIQIDVLINNAARADKSEEKINIDELKKTLHINLVGTITLTQLLLSRMNENAVIVNMSSEFGSLTEDWGCRVPSYRIAKAAINMYTRNLYDCEEVKEKNITVYSFDPGWVKTDMGGPHAEREPHEPAEEIVALVESRKTSGLFYRGLEQRAW